MPNFKYSLILASLLLSAQYALAINVIDIQVSENDLLKYKEKPLAYKFNRSQMSINGGEWMAIEEMETRGQSSIAASRRNFGVKLPEKINLNALSAKNLNITSMWIDKGYVASKFGLMTASHLNIGTPLHTDFSEVRINGKSNGLYLIVEKPKAAAKKSPYIVRRGYKSRFKSDEAKAAAELTRADVNRIEQVRDSIYSVLNSKSGADLFNDLRQKMDIESYMKLIVMNSLYRNGDGADEVFFYVDGDLYKQGRIFFRVMPWDFDDLFKEMHNSEINKSEFAKNPNSLVYNYEDKLDLKFANDPFLYGQLKMMTQRLLTNELSSAQVASLIGKVQTELMPYLERADVLEMGKVDGGRKGKPYTKEEILNIIATRKMEIEKRRAWMLQRI